VTRVIAVVGPVFWGMSAGTPAQTPKYGVSPRQLQWTDSGLNSRYNLLMEQCDIYDEAGRPTGRVVDRGSRLSQGEYILVVQVWIRNEIGEYLVQQRAHHLEFEPGIWATTAGHIQAGEDSLTGVVREVFEELGLSLSPGNLKRIRRLVDGHLIQDVWFVEVSKQVLETPVMGSEVADWMWASKARIDEMVTRGLFFAYSYLGSIPG
jgi:8-oxo-dGTP diphosphatase